MNWSSNFGLINETTDWSWIFLGVLSGQNIGKTHHFTLGYGSESGPFRWLFVSRCKTHVYFFVHKGLSYTFNTFCCCGLDLSHSFNKMLCDSIGSLNYQTLLLLHKYLILNLFKSMQHPWKIVKLKSFLCFCFFFHVSLQ